MTAKKKTTTKKSVPSSTTTGIDSIPLTHIQTLPSGFVPYPEGISIYARPYTLGETRKLSGHLSPAETFKIILAGVTVEGHEDTGFKVDLLSMNDVAYLALTRKVLTLGSRGEVEISLSSTQPGGDPCVFSRTLNFSEIEFRDFEAKAVPITADRLGGRQNVKFWPISVHAYLNILKWFPQRTEDELLVLAAYISEGPEGPASKEELIANEELISGLVGEDRVLLDMVDKALDHGAEDIEVPMTDPPPDPDSPPEVTSVRVSLSDDNLDFFRPKGGAGDDIKSRLQFG